MTTFTELYDETVKKTARPQLVELTKSCVSEAALRAHHVDFFPRDREILSTVYTVNSSNPFVNITNIYSLFPRLRAIESVVGLEVTSQLPTERFEYEDYTAFYDADGTLQYSKWDVIGATLKLVAARQTGLVELVVYQNPVVTEVGFNSWIADLYKEQLAWWAASLVQARSGALELAQASMRQSVEPFQSLLVASHMQPIAR